MSILRQLLISVVVVTALLLIGLQALNIDTARRYLSEELQTRGKTAAATLATVYTHDPAPAEAEWRAVAKDIFSSGAYRRIDVHGNLAFEYRKQDTPDGVPAWFASLISLTPPPASRPFRAANGVQGTVTVVADDSSAVRALWWHSLGLAALVAFAGLCWLVYARGLVRTLQKRLLHGISAQVRALAPGDPEPAALPAWSEVADVVDALAEARERFRMTAEETNARIESLQLELNLDSVTRLPNRKYFFNELRRALNNTPRDPSAESGHVLMFRQRDLAAINRHMPRDFTDQWLRSVGLRLDQKLGRRHVPAFLLARLNGSDFALLLDGVPAVQADSLAEQLRQELRTLRVSLGETQWCRWALAMAPYSRGDHASELLALLDHALMRAESADTDAPVRAEALPGAQEAAGELQWRDTLVMALEQHRFSLATQSLQKPDGAPLREEGTLMLHGADTQAPIPARRFMPAAIRLGLSPECDVQAVRLALDWLVSHGDKLAITIALPSLGQSNFLARLGQMLRDRPAQAGRLVFEIEARGLVENFVNVRALCEVVCDAGARIGVRRLADDFSAMTRLHELPIAYVKLGESFVDAMSRSPGSRHLAASVRETAKGLGVEVYADGRTDPDTRAFLERAGIVSVGYAAEPLHA